MPQPPEVSASRLLGQVLSKIEANTTTQVGLKSHTLFLEPRKLRDQHLQIRLDKLTQASDNSRLEHLLFLASHVVMSLMYEQYLRELEENPEEDIHDS